MIYLFIAFFLTILLGVPVAFCLGLGALAFLLITGRESLLIIPTLMFSGIDSFPFDGNSFFHHGRGSCRTKRHPPESCQFS